MPTKFVTGSEILKSIDRVIGEEADVSIAVAFWGNGSADRLLEVRRKRPRSIRIVCDLFSGSCNPSEIRKLLGEASIKTLDGMHAKVWLAGKKAVVGSANASANGLGFEGPDTQANVEAGALFEGDTDPIRQWFDELWDNDEAVTVDLDQLSRAELIWKYRQNLKTRQKSKSIFQITESEAKETLKRVRILAYPSGANKKYTRIFNSEFRHKYSDYQLDMYPNELPYYSDNTGWPVKIGEKIIDFTVAGIKSRARYGGIWEVIEIHPLPGRTNDKMFLCNPLPDIGGMPFSKLEINQMGDMVKKCISDNRLWPAGKSDEEHYNYLDMPAFDFFRSVGLLPT